MPDIVFVAIVLGFFAAASGFVLLCDRIIDPSVEASAAPTPGRAAEPPSARAA